LRLNELQSRLKQFRAYHQCKHAAHHEHGKGKPQVQGADVLVIRGIQPAPPAMRVIMGFVNEGVRYRGAHDSLVGESSMACSKHARRRRIGSQRAFDSKVEIVAARGIYYTRRAAFRQVIDWQREELARTPCVTPQ
jgi:hypothetical protein